MHALLQDYTAVMKNQTKSENQTAIIFMDITETLFLIMQQFTSTIH